MASTMDALTNHKPVKDAARPGYGLGILALVMLACEALLGPPAATSTPVPSATDTVAPTATSTPSPSTTPEPTETPMPPSPTLSADEALALTLTAWPTLLLSQTLVPSDLGCKFNWQSPHNGTIYDPQDVFTVGWNVTNTGASTWTPGSVQLTWVAGAKMSAEPTARLKASVAPGQSVVLSVQMRAPKNSTLYTTHWSLRRGNTYFCPLTLSIYVD